MTIIGIHSNSWHLDKNFVKWNERNRSLIVFANWFHEIIYFSICGNYENLLLLFFGKNSVKVTFLLKKLIWRNFNYSERKYFIFAQIYSHIFHKNFVTTTILLIKSLYNWFDEIFFGESKFVIFPHFALWRLPDSRTIVWFRIFIEFYVKSISMFLSLKYC